MKSENYIAADPTLVLPNVQLSEGPISILFRAFGCENFAQAARYVMHLPYGRNTCRANFELVLSERKGTCSTKHALLAALGRELGIEIELMLGLFDMCEKNTPGVGEVLGRYGLCEIPEAHCFLRYHGMQVDITVPPTIAAKAKQIYREQVITPKDIGMMKESFHRQVLRDWAERRNLSFELVWQVRNECIMALSNNPVPVN